MPPDSRVLTGEKVTLDVLKAEGATTEDILTSAILECRAGGESILEAAGAASRGFLFV